MHVALAQVPKPNWGIEVLLLRGRVDVREGLAGMVAVLIRL